jgi:hypothetical protein
MITSETDLGSLKYLFEIQESRERTGFPMIISETKKMSPETSSDTKSNFSILGVPK